MGTQLRRWHSPRQKYSSMLVVRLIIVVASSMLFALGILLWIQHTGNVVPVYWYVVLPIFFTALSLTLSVVSRLSMIKAGSPARDGVKQCPSTQQPSSEVISAIDVEPHNSLWQLPYQRNPFFTGREDILRELRQTLLRKSVATLTQPQTNRGLGGIGKTQTAAEYAHRYSKEYRAVLWVNATSRQTLFSAIASLARTLNLPEKEVSNQNRAFDAVKNWLDAHSDWLLIFDNVEDVVLVSDFFADPEHGHVLITTSIRATKVIEGIEVPVLSSGESVTFLLNRAGLLPPNSPSAGASSGRGTSVREVSELLAGLPFALELAGAYMRETQCSFSDYIEYYQAQRAKRLQVQGVLATDHPEAAAVTCSLAFQGVQKADATAADLLRLVAYLSPDGIPEDLIMVGITDLDLTLETNAVSKQRLESAYRLLQRYSLIHYDDATRTLAVHPLVQSILKQEMKRKVQHQWAERVTRLVSQTFPSVEPSTWGSCEKYLPHALVCVAHIKNWKMTFPEAVQLLNQAAYYLEVRGQCIEAQSLYQNAWIIRERTLGPLHPLTAASLTTLARFYEGWGKYWHAASFYRRARTIYEKILGPTHPTTVESIISLARLYRTIDHLPR